MPLPIGAPLPSLDGATGWIGEAVVAAGDGPSSPTLIQFWAVSCPVCKANVPRLLGLLEEFRPRGLRLVSVHMPRMESDMDIEQVRAAAEALGLTGPCALDNAHTLGNLYETGNVWPCYFLFDAAGRLRSRAAGALGLKMAENSLRRMLEPDKAMAAVG